MRREKSPRFSPEEVAEAITSARGNFGEAARLLGVDASTVWRYRAKFPEIDETWRTRLMALVEEALTRTVAAMRAGDGRARRLILEQCGRYIGLGRNAVEVIHHSADPAEEIDLLDYSDEDLAEATQLLAEYGLLSLPEGKSETE